MSQHGKQLPFVVDPTGQYDREVNASTAAATKMGLQHTPTILVVTPTHWIEVADPNQMYRAIDQAQAEAAHTNTASVHHPAAHK